MFITFQDFIREELEQNPILENLIREDHYIKEPVCSIHSTFEGPLV